MTDEMTKGLAGVEQLDISPFMEELVSSGPLEEVPCVYDTVYETVRDSIQNGLAGETKKRLAAFYEREELLAEMLDVSDLSDPAASRRYYFGQMKAVADLLSDVARQEEETQEVLELSKRFPYLPRCLEIVDSSEPVSGQELREQLDLEKGRFSYFISQVEPYRLFYVQKRGNSNYYSLAPRGRRALHRNVIAGKLGESRRVCSEQFLVFLLDSVMEENKSGGRNASRVLLKANLKCGGSGLQGETPELYHSLQCLLETMRPQPASSASIKAEWFTTVKRRLKALEGPMEPEDVYGSNIHFPSQASGGLKYGDS